MTQGTRVLVTGAAGFFGRAIVRALSDAGMQVLATDRTPSDLYSPRDAGGPRPPRYSQRDLATEPLDDLVTDVDAVVHAAALTPGAEHGEILDELLAVNLGVVLGVLAATRASERCSRLVYISSAGVYDQTLEGILNEDRASGGTSLYGAAKRAAELVVERYGTLTELEFCSVRPTSLFGSGEIVRPSRPRVTSFRQLVEAARSGAPVRVENLDSRLDWLHVGDAADAVARLLALDHLPGCSLNLSSGRPLPFREVVDALRSSIGLRVDDEAVLVVSGGADRPAVIDNSLVRRWIDWEPRRTFAEAARAIVSEVDGDAVTPSVGFISGKASTGLTSDAIDHSVNS